MKPLPLDFIMKKHNMEMHLTKALEPRLHFLDVLPTATTETGEFSTVVSYDSAQKDIEEGVLSEPIDTAEASELTQVDISPITTVQGRTKAIGYEFNYTREFKNRAEAPANLQLALSKIVAGMAIKINHTILSQMVSYAGVDVPNEVSDWSDDNDIDARKDAILMRDEMRTNNYAFELTDVYISNDRFVNLEDYMMSIDHPFDSKRIDVDGTDFHNVHDSFANISETELIGLDRNTPPGVLQKKIDPKFSLIREAELQGRTDLPEAIIQIQHYEENKYPFNEGYAIWCEIGYSNYEADGIMAGEIVD